LALSGVVFAVLFLVGWFASGGDAPDYGAPDQDWIDWADDNQWKSRIGAFAIFSPVSSSSTSRRRSELRSEVAKQTSVAFPNSLASRSPARSSEWRR
jgi:hypothetical protein